ncbi:hypothetical protein Dip518_001362 [Parelusimicrobium proximum]|uniref:hypothetical protein n=1 Tax=Parelusimicrobium proximum TaxID=3228953 RepID=UPI003D184727
MKKLLVCLISALAAAYPVAAQNILEGYAPVASPSGAYRYIRTISDTKASGKAEFDIVDIKTNAKLTSSAGATTSELKVYGTAKTTDAGMETLNVGTMNKTTGGYVKAKINKADKASAYTIQDVATVTTYRANLNGSNTTPTLKLSNTKLFPNTLPGTGNNALLSTVGKNMEWKALKDASDKSHTILVINMGAGSSAPSCTPLTATQQSNCINTGGSYDAVNCKCTCPTGKTLNTSTYKCEAPVVTKVPITIKACLGIDASAMMGTIEVLVNGSAVDYVDFGPFWATCQNVATFSGYAVGTQVEIRARDITYYTTSGEMIPDPSTGHMVYGKVIPYPTVSPSVFTITSANPNIITVSPY